MLLMNRFWETTDCSAIKNYVMHHLKCGSHQCNLFLKWHVRNSYHCINEKQAWTTVSGDFQGDVYDLHISKVILVYLGQDRYARLWKKSAPIENSYVGPNFNYAPMANPPATLTEGFHTVQTLLELHGDDLDSEEQNRMENRVIFTELLSDAMDKVVEHLDTCPIPTFGIAPSQSPALPFFEILDPPLHRAENWSQQNLLTCLPRFHLH